MEIAIKDDFIIYVQVALQGEAKTTTVSIAYSDPSGTTASLIPDAVRVAACAAK